MTWLDSGVHIEDHARSVGGEMVGSESGERPEDLVGTWVRGADGSLYFIPDRDMEAFRVSEPEEASAPRAGAADVKPNEEEIEPLPALRGHAGLRDLKVRGPFALKDLMQGPNAIVPPGITLRGLRDVD